MAGSVQAVVLARPRMEENGRFPAKEFLSKFDTPFVSKFKREKTILFNYPTF